MTVIPIRFSKALLEKFGAAIEQYWNGQWKQTTIQYQVDGTTFTDPRTLLTASFTPDKQTEDFLALIKDYDNDEKAFEIHRFILTTRKFKYISDKIAWNKTEKWQTPQETQDRMTGDCEDASLYWLKLAQLSGIPSYRRKCYCGDTAVGGHCYPCYLTEEGNRWVSMDLTYYYRVIRVEYRAALQDIDLYGNVWFTFNESMCWAQHDTIIKIGTR